MYSGVDKKKVRNRKQIACQQNSAFAYVKQYVRMYLACGFQKTWERWCPLRWVGGMVEHLETPSLHGYVCWVW